MTAMLSRIVVAILAVTVLVALTGCPTEHPSGAQLPPELQGVDHVMLVAWTEDGLGSHIPAVCVKNSGVLLPIGGMNLKVEWATPTNKQVVGLRHEQKLYFAKAHQDDHGYICFDGPLVLVTPGPIESDAEALARFYSGRSETKPPTHAGVLKPGHQISLIFWNNAGHFRAIEAKIDQTKALIHPDPAEFAALPEDLKWEKCSQPGFKTDSDQDLFWLGSTGLNHDGSLSFDPTQIEVVDTAGFWDEVAGIALHDHYKKMVK